MSDQIFTIGQLRAALADMPDDRPLWAQVVAKDGSAWSMAVKFSPIITRSCEASLLTLYHSNLETLSNEGWKERT